MKFLFVTTALSLSLGVFAKSQEFVMVDETMSICRTQNLFKEVDKLACKLCYEKTGVATSKAIERPNISQTSVSWGDRSCSLYLSFYVQAKYICLGDYK